MVTLGPYTFLPDPLVSQQDNIEEKTEGSETIKKMGKTFSLNGALVGDSFASLVVKKAAMESAIFSTDLLAFNFGDGNVYQVNVASVQFEEGTWTSYINYSIELTTEPTYLSSGAGYTVSAKVSESYTPEYVDTDVGKTCRLLTIEYSFDGIIVIKDKNITTLETQRNILKALFRVDDADNVRPITYLGYTGRVSAVQFGEVTDDETHQTFTLTLQSEDYVETPVETESLNTSTNREYFGESNTISKTTVSYAYSGTIFLPPGGTFVNPTPTTSGSSGYVTYKGSAGRLEASEWSYNRAERQATYSFTITEQSLNISRAEKVEVSRSVTYIGDTNIVQRIETTYSLSGTISDPAGVTDPTSGIDVDYGNITFGTPGNEITGLYQGSSFSPNETKTQATYQVSVKIKGEKIRKLSEKKDKSMTVQRQGTSNLATKIEYNWTYSGYIESETDAILSENTLNALIPTPSIGDIQILYNGQYLKSAGYTLDEYGRTATYQIQTYLTSNQETLPDGIIDWDISLQITPRQTKYAETLIPGGEEAFQDVGETIERKTLSGFYVGTTLANAQAAADALIPQTADELIVLSVQQTVTERENKVSFTYTTGEPLLGL